MLNPAFSVGTLDGSTSMIFGWTAQGRAVHKRRMLQSLALAGILFSTPGHAGGIAGVDVRGDRVVVRFDERVEGASAFPVSYTHLTLPTIYSV